VTGMTGTAVDATGGRVTAMDEMAGVMDAAETGAAAGMGVMIVRPRAMFPATVGVRAPAAPARRHRSRMIRGLAAMDAMDAAGAMAAPETVMAGADAMEEMAAAAGAAEAGHRAPAQVPRS